MKGETLTLTDVTTDGTLADVTAGDSFEVLQTWTDNRGDTRASIGTYYDGSDLVKESHTVVVSEQTLKFAPDAASINTIAKYE